MRHAIVLFVLAASCVAQRHFIVDAGGGGDFLDLPLALAQARDGDVFDVRPGVYTPGLVRAGVAIRGGDGRELRRGPFVVRGVAAAATFTMSGFAARVGADAVTFYAMDCAGPVVFQRLTAVPPGVPRLEPAAVLLRVWDAAAVTAQECAFRGENAVEVRGAASRLSLTASTVRGRGATAAVGHAALRLTGGHVEVVDSTLRGADGGLQPPVQGGIAAVLTDGALRAARATIEGGRSVGATAAWREPGFDIAPGASARVDPNVTWSTGPAPGPHNRPVVATVPAVGTPSVLAGGAIAPTWSGGLGAPSLLGLSLAGPPLPSPWGPIDLDPATTVAMHVGPAVADPPAFALSPAIPAGTALVLQGIVLLPGDELVTTNAQRFTLR